jgi:hypothetical protein
MGYGHRDSSLLGFSWQHGIDDFAVCRSASRLSVNGPISQKGPPTRLPRDNHHPGSSILLRPPSAIRQRLGQLAQINLNSPNVATLGPGAVTVVLEYQPVVHRLRLSASP